MRVLSLVAAAVVAALLVSPPALAGRTVSASWYGPGLYGNRMACGQTLHSWTVGVAHRWLPCYSRVTVCYRGRCVRTVVVDRGPFVRGRELDLTARLAGYLGFTGVRPVWCSAC